MKRYWVSIGDIASWQGSIPVPIPVDFWESIYPSDLTITPLSETQYQLDWVNNGLVQEDIDLYGIAIVVQYNNDPIGSPNGWTNIYEDTDANFDSYLIDMPQYIETYYRVVFMIDWDNMSEYSNEVVTVEWGT